MRMGNSNNNPIGESQNELKQQEIKIDKLSTKLGMIKKECERLRDKIKTEDEKKICLIWCPEIELLDEKIINDNLQILINKIKKIEGDLIERRNQKLTDEENERLNKVYAKYCSSTTKYKSMNE
jgi:hypothetical protein